MYYGTGVFIFKFIIVVIRASVSDLFWCSRRTVDVLGDRSVDILIYNCGDKSFRNQMFCFRERFLVIAVEKSQSSR